MVNQQTRQISILCFRVVLFEVVLEILLDFPHGPSKNVKSRGFFCPFLAHTLNQTMAGSSQLSLIWILPCVPIKEAVTVRSGKRMYSSGQPKLSAYARTRFRVWVVVLSQGNKLKSLVRQRFSGKLMFCLRFREACERVTL